ncbi:hypothetical protein J3R82DRAFT_2331, partial [Butyriboletus roseoflavus]
RRGTFGGIIVAFLARSNVPHEVAPFGGVFHQECVDAAIQCGYLMDGTPVPCGRTCVKAPPTQQQRMHIHLTVSAICSAWIFFVDAAMTRFPLEIIHMYRFNERFVRRQTLGNGVLEALTDLPHKLPDFFQPVPSNSIVTATLNFVTASIVEHESKNMQILPFGCHEIYSRRQWVDHWRCPAVWITCQRTICVDTWAFTKRSWHFP